MQIKSAGYCSYPSESVGRAILKTEFRIHSYERERKKERVLASSWLLMLVAGCLGSLLLLRGGGHSSLLYITGRSLFQELLSLLEGLLEGANHIEGLFGQ